MIGEGGVKGESSGIIVVYGGGEGPEPRVSVRWRGLSGNSDITELT